MKKIFRTKAAEKLETHILGSITLFFLKSCCLYDNVEKILYSGAGHM